MFALFSAVFIGGGIGSVLCWYVSVKLTHSDLPFPAGALLVNLIGAFIIGLALVLFPRMPQLDDPAWKLLLTTGFCGGLTTFFRRSSGADGRPQVQASRFNQPIACKAMSPATARDGTRESGSLQARREHIRMRAWIPVKIGKLFLPIPTSATASARPAA